MRSTRCSNSASNTVCNNVVIYLIDIYNELHVGNSCVYAYEIIYTIALFCTVVAGTARLVICFQFPPLGTYVGQCLFYTPLVPLIFTRN